MNRPLLSLFSLIIFGLSNLASAQISINSQDILNMIGTVTEAEVDTNGNVPFNPGSAGENQTWDFSTKTINGYQTTLEYTTADGTPFVDDYPGANFVFKSELKDGAITGEVYTYHTITSENFTALGGGIISNGFSILQSAGGEYTPLPIAYGNEWTISASDTLTIVDGFFTVTNKLNQNKVDAWGTLKLPAGDFASLRIIEESLTLTETYVSNILISSDTSTAINYEWIGQDALLLLYAQGPEGESDPNFDTAKEFGWLTKLTTTDIDNDFSQKVPDTYELNQNYPNPFNPETIISYSLPQKSEVSLTIYDITGKLIDIITPGLQSAGTHEVRWQAANYLSSGAYLYQIKAGNYISTKKMILLR